MKQHKNISNFNDLLNAEYGTHDTAPRQLFEHEAKAAYLTDLIKSQQSQKIAINWRQLLLENMPDIALVDLIKLLDSLKVKLNFVPSAD
jgi:phage/plasmid-associated DNA primase